MKYSENSPFCVSIYGFLKHFTMLSLSLGGNITFNPLISTFSNILYAFHVMFIFMSKFMKIVQNADFHVKTLFNIPHFVLIYLEMTKYMVFFLIFMCFFDIPSHDGKFCFSKKIIVIV